MRTISDFDSLMPSCVPRGTPSAAAWGLGSGERFMHAHALHCQEHTDISTQDVEGLSYCGAASPEASVTQLWVHGCTAVPGEETPESALTGGRD